MRTPWQSLPLEGQPLRLSWNLHHHRWWGWAASYHPPPQMADRGTTFRGYWRTRGYANSRTGRLTDWTSRGLDNSRTGQVADWTTRRCHQRLCVLSFPVWRHLRDRELSSPRLVQSVSWLVRELSSPRVDQSARCPVRELAICELAYPRVVQLPLQICMLAAI